MPLCLEDMPPTRYGMSEMTDGTVTLMAWAVVTKRHGVLKEVCMRKEDAEKKASEGEGLVVQGITGDCSLTDIASHQKAVDWTKPIQTRNGRKARFLCSGIAGPYPVEVAVLYGDGMAEKVEQYTGLGPYRSGEYSQSLDIINVPPRKEKREVVAWAIVDSSGSPALLSFSESWARGSRGAGSIVRLTGTYEVEVTE